MQIEGVIFFNMMIWYIFEDLLVMLLISFFSVFVCNYFSVSKFYLKVELTFYLNEQLLQYALYIDTFSKCLLICVNPEVFCKNVKYVIYEILIKHYQQIIVES